VEAPKPDLVIYLQAPLSVLQERIALRGRAMERGLDDAYLESLSDAYARFFHFYDEAPLLIVNAAELDWVHNDDHFAALLTRIKGPLSARQYFNPHPSLL
jgi:deoxyadenosine/deoxycytidine kinase